MIVVVVPARARYYLCAARCFKMSPQELNLYRAPCAGHNDGGRGDTKISDCPLRAKSCVSVRLRPPSRDGTLLVCVAYMRVCTHYHSYIITLYM